MQVLTCGAHRLSGAGPVVAQGATYDVLPGWMTSSGSHGRHVRQARAWSWQYCLSQTLPFVLSSFMVTICLEGGDQGGTGPEDDVTVQTCLPRGST